MANNNWRNPANTQVAQVETITITADSTDNDETWTLTLTLDDGSTETVAYTEDGSPTPTEIAAGLVAAWNASTKPNIARITAANPSAGVFTLTADTAGVPFSVALADTGDGTHTQTTTTANVGNNDAGLDQNWSQDDAPDTGDDLILDFGSVGIKYGLNQSAIAIADLVVGANYLGEIGRFQDGKLFYWRIDPDTFKYKGRGPLAAFDIGSANIAVGIEAYGNPSAQGRHNVYLLGSNISTLEIVKGNVGLAVHDGESATVGTILIGHVGNPAGDSNVTIGEGVTLTTLDHSAGKCFLRCAATTVGVSQGATLETEGTGAITTLNAHGTVYPKSTGTITTLNCYGTVDFTKDRSARTVSTLNMKPGGKVILHPGITVSAWGLPASDGSFTIEWVS